MMYKLACMCLRAGFLMMVSAQVFLCERCAGFVSMVAQFLAFMNADMYRLCASISYKVFCI